MYSFAELSSFFFYFASHLPRSSLHPVLLRAALGSNSLECIFSSKGKSERAQRKPGEGGRKLKKFSNALLTTIPPSFICKWFEVASAAAAFARSKRPLETLLLLKRLSPTFCVQHSFSVMCVLPWLVVSLPPDSYSFSLRLSFFVPLSLSLSLSTGTMRNTVDAPRPTASFPLALLRARTT